jgi:hypothetical protein
MKFTLLDLYCFSIGIAAIIGVVRFKKINPAYYPFIYLVWIAFATEIVSYFLIYSGHYNAIPYNVYVLLESQFLVWQFRRWGLFRNGRWLFFGLLITMAVAWFAEAFFIHGIYHTISYFRILHCFLVVIMSIIIVSEIITREPAPILKNSTFLICMGFIIYFTFRLFVGIFTLWGQSANKEFRMNIGMIPVYLNVFTNLIYALAVLWMPRRLRFTMPS